MLQIICGSFKFDQRVAISECIVTIYPSCWDCDKKVWCQYLWGLPPIWTSRSIYETPFETLKKPYFCHNPSPSLTSKVKSQKDLEWLYSAVAPPPTQTFSYIVLLIFFNFTHICVIVASAKLLQLYLWSADGERWGSKTCFSMIRNDWFICLRRFDCSFSITSCTSPSHHQPCDQNIIGNYKLLSNKQFLISS